MTGKEVIKILAKKGWKLLRVNGSHHRLGKDELRITVPVHGTQDLGKGLLTPLEKQTGVTLK